MANIGIGLDIGADSTKVVVGRMNRDLFVPIKAAILPKSENSSYVLAPFLNGLGISGNAILGITGKDMIIRYTQTPPMPDWQLKQVMDFEIQDLASQSGGGLSADFNRLDIVSSLSEDDTVLLTLIKDDRLDDSAELLKGSKVNISGFTPNSIALFNLISRTAEVETGTSLVVDIGSENIDIAIIQDGALIFARNISGGSNIFDQAISESFNVSAQKAEKVKKELGCILSRKTVKEITPQQEKVGRRLSASAGRIYSMIQSSLMFCKAQIKVADISLDRVFLTGGGARLKGLDSYLSDNLGVPVEIYDPTDIFDITSLSDPADFTTSGLEFSSAMGLAMMAASTEYYSIQVLPEALKKKQYFQKHTIFGILAAIILLAFLGAEFYISMNEAGVLDKDIKRRQKVLDKKKRDASEMSDLYDENSLLVTNLNILDERIVPLTGLVRTYSLIQKYLPEDLWITSIEIQREEREEFKLGNKKIPVIKVKGSGKEMGQPLQTSFTEFKMKLDSDPMTAHVIPQVRYEDFSFTLTINYTRFLPEAEVEVDDETVMEE